MSSQRFIDTIFNVYRNQTHSKMKGVKSVLVNTFRVYDRMLNHLKVALHQKEPLKTSSQHLSTNSLPANSRAIYANIHSGNSPSNSHITQNTLFYYFYNPPSFLRIHLNKLLQLANLFLYILKA